MADTTLQTFCCVETNQTRPGADLLLRFRSGPYNIVCIIFSICGILGATYQILPRRDVPSGVVRRQSASQVRSRYIIVWLATADLMASLAVLIRSVSWLTGKNFLNPLSTMGITFDTLFCAVSSAWIQYFYTATCLWTLCYAVDVFKVVNERCGVPKIYHLVAWGLPALLCTIGLSILYTPDLNCHSMSANPFRRVLPNYIFTYLPIVVVMIVNPILYWKTSERAQQLIVSISGRFTTNERKHLRDLKIKFLCINLVFYICWIPNIINAILLWTLWQNMPRGFVLFDWYLMAIFNPLQACFNAIVYRKWGDTKTIVVFPWTKINTKSQDSEGNSLIDSNSPSGNGVEGEDAFKSASFNSYGSL